MSSALYYSTIGTLSAALWLLLCWRDRAKSSRRSH